MIPFVNVSSVTIDIRGLDKARNMTKAPSTSLFAVC